MKSDRDAEGRRFPVGITNGPLLGKPIQVLTASENIIYAGTQKRFYIATIGHLRLTKTLKFQYRYGTEWKTPPLIRLPIKAINVPHWDDTQIYVGTQKGLYASNNAGETWNPGPHLTFTAIGLL